MNIRKEQKSDIECIWRVNAAAFETWAEANLINALRESGVPFISLVAEEDRQIVGHILFTPVELAGGGVEIKIIGLAPMAVTPAYQLRGIGSQLVRAGLNACVEGGYEAVVVLGHPWFYPKFGFRPSVQFGIKSEYDVPDDVFMLLELNEGVLKGKHGTIKFHNAFKDV